MLAHDSNPLPRDPAASSPAAPRGHRLGAAAWAARALYWTSTLIVAYEMIAGGLWDLLRIEYVRVVMEHLGYPLYVLLIIGVWKIPCGAVLLLPRFLRVKEWAYTGSLLNYAGAAASHFLVGDRAGKWVAPLVFAAFTVTSWSLRPPERRLATGAAPPPPRRASWVVTIGLFAALVVLSLVTLPAGPPPP
ncbi:hypothetical protein A2cp1_3402 [Anaeromyxobacter dehalogenans 2CP-1]|uniref:DoxX family protein n=1 Tax=Anaeromyxobacter dehalogenans (strain ATCC BAA-258 / DSM 21875 / 2CP-1) TaxID=455488 RepID=B8JHM2_ANAD2|nr:DoxX family protein [Anaeromyxobacter dehalogenans]ACL66734.1 hypothetical protein A2cp1_3402 [Anaeromyxobacter dehalogenans 2CP-1]